MASTSSLPTSPSARSLAEEHPSCRVTFEVGNIDNVIQHTRVDDYDLILGLSVFHHIIHERGAAAVRDMLTSLSQKAAAAIFEMAVREEPVYWASSLPASPRDLLQGFAFVHRVAEYDTHLSDIRRPLYFASNRYWLLNHQMGAFHRFSTEFYPGARGGL